MKILAAACLLVFALTLPQAGACSEQPEIDPGKLAARIHELVNMERERRHVPPLAWNDALAEIALGHSREMSEYGYLSHINRAGETPTERGIGGGFICRKRFDSYKEEGLAENVLQNSLFHAVRYTRSKAGETRERLWSNLEELAASTVQGWMTTKGHRENLLNPKFDTEGIGVGIAKDGKVYVTQLFC